MKATILEEILKAPNLPEIIQELQKKWQAEQQKRHQFWAEVDESQKAEFILGEIIYHSPVYGRHWKASSRICRILIPHVYDNKLGEVGIEKVMIRMTRNDYEPDICFWKTETAKNFTEKQSAFPPPNFIIEILSDSTEKRDRGIKMEDYALHGVSEYWLIDTDKKFVEQYLLKETQFELVLKMKEGILKSPIIEGFKIEVKDIFSED